MTRSVHLFLIAALLGVLGHVGAARATSPTLQAAKLCRKTLTTQGRTYAKKRLALLDACVDKLLKCEIQLEVDGSNPNSCRSLALTSCTNSIGPASDSVLSKAATNFATKVTLACAGYPFGKVLSDNTAADGLWFGEDTTCGTSPDLPTLASCLRGELEARVDGVAGEVKPRASLLLDNTPLGANFPNLPRPPTTSVVVSGTGSGGSLTLVNPGTINLPAGNALVVTGDGTGTLNNGCSMGMGQNGKLTITVGSQEQTLKEPYGPTRAAVFGPYTSSATIPYTIDLKDSSCMDSTSGNVSVP